MPPTVAGEAGTAAGQPPAPLPVAVEDQRESAMQIVRWHFQQARAALQPESLDMRRAQAELRSVQDGLEQLERLLPERQARLHLDAARAWLANGQPAKAEPHLRWALYLWPTPPEAVAPQAPAPGMEAPPTEAAGQPGTPAAGVAAANPIGVPPAAPASAAATPSGTAAAPAATANQPGTPVGTATAPSGDAAPTPLAGEGTVIPTPTAAQALPTEPKEILLQTLTALQVQDLGKAQLLLHALSGEQPGAQPAAWSAPELMAAISHSIDFAVDALGRGSRRIAEIELEGTQGLLDQLETRLAEERIIAPLIEAVPSLPQMPAEPAGSDAAPTPPAPPAGGMQTSSLPVSGLGALLGVLGLLAWLGERRLRVRL